MKHTIKLMIYLRQLNKKPNMILFLIYGRGEYLKTYKINDKILFVG